MKLPILATGRPPGQSGHVVSNFCGKTAETDLADTRQMGSGASFRNVGIAAEVAGSGLDDVFFKHKQPANHIIVRILPDSRGTVKNN